MRTVSEVLVLVDRGQASIRLGFQLRYHFADPRRKHGCAVAGRTAIDLPLDDKLEARFANGFVPLANLASSAAP